MIIRLVGAEENVARRGDLNDIARKSRRAPPEDGHDELREDPPGESSTVRRAARFGATTAGQRV